MLVRSEIAGQKQILWIFGYTEGKNRLILSLGLGGIIQERGEGLKYPLCWSDFLHGAGCALQSSLHTRPACRLAAPAKRAMFALLCPDINFQINHRRLKCSGTSAAAPLLSLLPAEMERLSHKFPLYANTPPSLSA